MNRESDQARRALALHKTGDPAGAEKIYRRILKTDPGNGRVRYYLGVACLEQGKFAAGRTVLEQALQRDPENSDILFSLGRALEKVGDRDAALRNLEAARDLAPERADVWAAIGGVLQQQHRLQEAITVYTHALELQPDDWQVYANAAIVQIGLGNLEEGAAMLRRLANDRQHPKVLLNLALAEQELGNFDAADRVFDKLLALDPNDIDAVAGRALNLRQLGQSSRAWELLQDLDDKSFRRSLPVLAFAKIAPVHDDETQRLTKRARDYIKALLGSPTIATPDQVQLNFARGHLDDRLGDFDAAFDAISAGSALAPVTYDRVATERRFQNLRTFFTEPGFAGLARSTIRSERPVFIVGMPRSGTSLVEQILDSHPEAAGAGELQEVWSIEKEIGAADRPDRLAEVGVEALNTFAERYLHLLHRVDATAARVSDKMPANFERLGLIALLFPDARVLHCVRDPLDTCLSSYFQDFRFRNAYSFSLENLGHYYAQYAALMRHWHAVLPIQMLDIRYEYLVEHPTETISEMLGFCGLDWDERCLAFHENPRIVATASADQVRRPLYTNSVGRAAHYRYRLEPLVQALQAQGVNLAKPTD
jgi:tetratricopeptide (TPR) repeat protein